MADLQTPLLHYDRRTIIFHWLTAALVIGLWCMGQTIDWFPKGGLRVFARSTHICFGIALAVTLALRMQWRFGARSVHLPPAGLGWLDQVATITHWLLYGLLITTLALGIANAWIRGDSIFDLFKISSIAPGNKGLKETVEELHGLAANALLILAFFHAAAGLLHHFVWKDAVLRRMLPERRRAP